MLKEVAGQRRYVQSSWDRVLIPFYLNEDLYFSAFYTVTSDIPQDLDPAYKWLLFPCFTLLINTVQTVSRKHGLAVVVHDQDVDGVDTGGGVPRKYGWGASFPNDPQSQPTPLPTLVNSAVEFYYEPGLMWQYFFAGAVSFRPRGGFAEGEGPPTSTYTVTLSDWPFDWRHPVVEKGDQFSATSGVIYLEDHNFIEPGVSAPKQLVMTFETPNELAGATWTVLCSELVVVPFAPISSPSTVIPGLGLPGVRSRGKIVGKLMGG